MRILALDPAESTGYALVDLIDGHADIYEYGFIEVDKSSGYQGDHCIDLMKQISDIIKTADVEYVCIEDYFFSQKFANGCNANASYRTALHILCRQLKLPYEILNISLWKKYVAGRSTPIPSPRISHALSEPLACRVFRSTRTAADLFG